MRLPASLIASMAVLSPSSPNRHARSLFTFGDSYTTTGFNSSSNPPSDDHPMGNPGLGQGTSCGGVNWVGYLTTTYNTSLILSYNLAVYGATINNSIIYSHAHDLVFQVSSDFRHHYCSSSEQSPTWEAGNSVFALWIGINDIHFSYPGSDPYGRVSLVLYSYFQLIRQLHECGAHTFLVINVPPTTRTPMMISLDRKLRGEHQKLVGEFNRQLEEAVIDFRKSYPLVSVIFYDSWSFMSNILDRPTKYGFRDATCIGEGCVWWDDYHPTSAFHRLLAADLQTHLGSKP